MKLSELKTILSQHSSRQVEFILPTGTKIPVHAHITDVARIDKHFIDCGGTIRDESVCRLQSWFADDTDHRVSASMLFKILGKASPLLRSDDLEVEIEYEAPFISQFPIAEAIAKGNALIFRLETRRTTCLAKETCAPQPAPRKAFSFDPLPAIQPAGCCS